MSRNYTTDAINLNSYDFSESDKIVVMYSKEKGLIRGIAKGCKKSKSKLGATMQSLVANKIIFNKGRNLDIISQAEAINSFKPLKNDFDKLTMSMYCAEIVSNYGVEEDTNAEEIYSLLYKALTSVSATKSKIELYMTVLRFQLQIMNLCGFKISLTSCANCNNKFEEDKSMKFSIAAGGAICNDCYDKTTNLSGKVVSINHKIIEFLETLSRTDFEEKTKYDALVTEKICITCFGLLKEYIQYHSTKKFKTLDVLECAI